jgi:DUF1680 family protein
MASENQCVVEGKMNRRNFVKSAALAPLAAGSLRPSFASQLVAEPMPKTEKNPAGAASGTPIHARYEVTLRRVLDGDAPKYTSEFVLEDVKATPGRRFTEFSGDVSGRYIGALATAARVYGTSFPELDGLVSKVIALQKPDGYFGSTFHYDHPTDNDLALLWGNGRLLVGLLEYYRLKPSPEVLAACKRLGDFLVRIGPLMLSQQIRSEFGAQHFASSYICWTQQTEGLANLYEITRNDRYRKLTEEIVAVTERRPSDHVHGYLSSLRGAMDLHRVSVDAGKPDAKVLATCEAAWTDITQSQDLLITGGVPEGWSPNNHRTEGCGEADWLRLNMMLWKATGNQKYLAMAERTIFNEFAFNQFAGGDFGHHVFTETGLPAGGAVRAWWCCTLHGLRCFPDIQSNAFRSEKDGLSKDGLSKDGLCKDGLHFDLPVDGRIETASLSASSASSLAHDGTVRITITPGKSGVKTAQTLRIRKPEWAAIMTVRINEAVELAPIEDGYARIQREWRDGDVVAVHYAMTLRSAPSGKDRVSYFFGPWLLGAPASENFAYFNELTALNKLTGTATLAQVSQSKAHPDFAVPIAAMVFKYIPAEFPEQPSTVTLRAIAEQAGQPTTSWELRFLT